MIEQTLTPGIAGKLLIVLRTPTVDATVFATGHKFAAVLRGLLMPLALDRLDDFIATGKEFSLVGDELAIDFVRIESI